MKCCIILLQSLKKGVSVKSIIISLAVLSCLFQGCEDSNSAVKASAVTGDSATPTVVTSQGTNESAINPPTLPNLSTPLPTENIKNLVKQ